MPKALQALNKLAAAGHSHDVPLADTRDVRLTRYFSSLISVGPAACTEIEAEPGFRQPDNGGYGGIAYHHIADTYIVLFTSFITCGVWEAVHILDALLKNRSEIQRDTLHADTQGQSEPVFGLSQLLGIKLMPSMRGLSDAMFYRPSKTIRYRHIDALFGGEVDWNLIATHARDMFQVALPVQAGCVMPSMLLLLAAVRTRA